MKFGANESTSDAAHASSQSRDDASDANAGGSFGGPAGALVGNDAAACASVERAHSKARSNNAADAGNPVMVPE